MLTFPNLDAGDVLTLKQLLDTYDSHFHACRGPAKASFIFWQLSQQDGQSFSQYYALLQHQAAKCAFDQDVDPIKRNLRDKIICGIKDESLRIRLFSDRNITLEKVVYECKAAEVEQSPKHAANLNKNGTGELAEIEVVKSHWKCRKVGNKQCHSSRKYQFVPNITPEKVVDERKAAELSRKRASQVHNNGTIKLAEVDVVKSPWKGRLVSNKPRQSVSNTTSTENKAGRPKVHQDEVEFVSCQKCGRYRIKGSCPVNGSQCNIRGMANHWVCQSVTKKNSETFNRSCQRCGRFHERGRCPAHGTLCNSCGKSNHWSAVCRAATKIGPETFNHPCQRCRKFHERGSCPANGSPCSTCGRSKASRRSAPQNNSLPSRSRRRQSIRSVWKQIRRMVLALKKALEEFITSLMEAKQYKALPSTMETGGGEVFAHDLPEINEVVVQNAVEKYAGLSSTACYRMESKPRGLAALFINEVFEGKDDMYRLGAAKDKQLLTGLFTQLGYKTLVFEDTPRNKMVDILKKFTQQEEHANMDSCVVVFSSHGKGDCIMCHDSKLVSMNEIKLMFDNDNCPLLRGKPKIFIVQACRGDNPDTGVPYSETDAIGYAPRPINNIPTTTDMLIAYSTTPGCLSNRNEKGSWYIYLITDVFMREAGNTRLLDMLIDVNNRMSRLRAKGGEKQAAETIWQCWRKKFYFNPGL